MKLKKKYFKKKNNSKRAYQLVKDLSTVTQRKATSVQDRSEKKTTTLVTAEIPDLCDKRRELRKKRFEPVGSEKYKEVNNI